MNTILSLETIQFITSQSDMDLHQLLLEVLSVIHIYFGFALLCCVTS